MLNLPEVGKGQFAFLPPTEGVSGMLYTFGCSDRGGDSREEDAARRAATNAQPDPHGSRGPYSAPTRVRKRGPTSACTRRESK